MLKCDNNFECPRLNYCYQNHCIHRDIFNTNDVNIILPLCLYSVFVGFSCAGNFGSGAVQIFFLMLWMNYSRQETSGIAQPMLAGICFAAWIRNIGQIHPLRNSPLIDYQLAVLLLPILLGAYIGGLNIRFYVPVFFISVCVLLQLIFVFVKTFMKVRSITAIENAHKVARTEYLKQKSLKDSTHKKQKKDKEVKNKTDLIHQEDVLNIIDINFGQEEYHMDYVEFFQKIANSKYKELYLQNLPSYILEEEFIDPEQDHEMSLKDLLQQTQNSQNTTPYQQAIDDQVQKREVNQQDTCKDTHTKKLKVSSIRIQKPTGENEELIFYDKSFQDIAIILENKKEQKIPSKKKQKHQDQIPLQKNPYVYPSPIVEILMMLLLITLNVINFIFRGGKKLESVGGIELCSENFWILFWFQIGGNYLLFIPIFVIQKIRHDREYKIAVEMNKQKNQQVTDNKSIQTQNDQQQKRIMKARIDFPYNFKAFSLFWLVGTFGGVFLGFIGIGSSLLMVIVLGKLRLNLQSINATIPMIIFFVCVLGKKKKLLLKLLGTLLQISVGSVEWKVSLFYFALSTLGAYLFNPTFQQLFKKLHISILMVKLALSIYENIQSIQTIYLWIWIPQIQKDVEKQFSVTSQTLC